MKNDPKTGRPSTFQTNANNKKVGQLVYSARRLTICTMPEQLGIANETVGTILVEKLGMQKVCAKMVPRL